MCIRDRRGMQTGEILVDVSHFNEGHDGTCRIVGRFVPVSYTHLESLVLPDFVPAKFVISPVLRSMKAIPAEVPITRLLSQLMQRDEI